MTEVKPIQIARWLGKRRMAQVKSISFEPGGFQVVLRPSLWNPTYETNGRFVPTDESLSEIKDDLLEFFSDIEVDKETTK